MTQSADHFLRVYPAQAFRVIRGARLGEAVSFADELELDDVYTLSPNIQPVDLSLQSAPKGGYLVATGSQTGRVGADVHFDCLVTLMAASGGTASALILVELDPNGHVNAVYLLPVSTLSPKAEYALVGIDATEPSRVFAQIACARFARGTHITLASGAQRAVEALNVGDEVLTRNNGPQEIKWIGQTTVRAEGAFAPIRIRAGALNNTRDLIVSPEHRLFIYQLADKLGAGRSELLIKARYLVNNESVALLEGGFIDYFQLLFDTHQIIYAEGIAAESTMVDPRTREGVPEDIRAQVTEGSPLNALETSEKLLKRADAAAILKNR